jgi:hypothetical protein
MKNELNLFITETKNSWESRNIKSTYLEDLAKSATVRKSLQENLSNLFKGVELYKDEEHGFILLAYAENKGTYRAPHNHGNAWVEYAVVSGLVEMGNYCGLSELILKNSDQLTAGDRHKYFPGEIHDTRCISENAIILRLTSCDLKVEEREGRMLRFNL